MSIYDPTLNLVARGWRKSALGYGGGLVFSRASDAAYRTSTGLLAFATTGVLRHDYDPFTGEYLGWLIEESRTNYCLYNRDLSNAAWTKTNATATKNQTGVDGVSSSASSIAATSNNGTVLQAITDSSRARATSAYVKRISGTGTLEMTCDNGSTWTTVTLTGDGPNGYSRVEIPTQTLSNPTVGFRIGTSGDSFAIDLVQTENGTTKTSAIATTSAAGTRAADVLSLAVTGWGFNAAEGTLFLEAGCHHTPGGSEFALQINDGSNNNYIGFSDLGSPDAYFRAAAGSAQTLGSTGSMANAMRKVALVYKASDFAVANSGVLGATSSSFTLPSGLTTLSIGKHASAAQIGGWIRWIRYWPRRLTNAELAAITL